LVITLKYNDFYIGTDFADDPAMNYVISKFNTLPEVLRHTLLFGFSMIGVRLVGFLLIPIFTHALTPSEYARLDLLQSLADIIGMIVIVGLADTLFKFYGEERAIQKKHAVAGRIYKLSVYLSLICVGLFQLLAPTINALLPLEIDIWSVRFILVSVSISPMILVALSWLRMEGHVTKFVQETILRSILQGIISVSVLVGGFGVSGVMAASMIASVITAYSLHRYLLKHQIWAHHLKYMSVYLQYGFPLIFVGIAGFFLRSFDRWMLADSIGAHDMALYALAVKFALIAAFLTQPYQMWLLPKRFALLKDKESKKKLGLYSIWGCAFTILTTACMSAGAPILVYIMTPEVYHASIRYIPLLCFCSAVHMATIYLNIGCYAQKTTKWPLIIDGISAVSVVALYIHFIPLYGAFGAIGAGVVILSLRLISTLIVSLAYERINYEVGKLLLLFGVYAGACAIQTIFSSSMSHQILIGIVNILIISVLMVCLKFVPLTADYRRTYVSNL